MSDEDFLEAFCTCALPLRDFDHRIGTRRLLVMPKKIVTRRKVEMLDNDVRLNGHVVFSQPFAFYPATPDTAFVLRNPVGGTSTGTGTSTGPVDTTRFTALPAATCVLPTGL